MTSFRPSPVTSPTPMPCVFTFVPTLYSAVELAEADLAAVHRGGRRRRAEVTGGELREDLHTQPGKSEDDVGPPVTCDVADRDRVGTVAVRRLGRVPLWG